MRGVARLEGLLARHELTLTAFTTAEREWQALVPSPAQDMVAFGALQGRHAAAQENVPVNALIARIDLARMGAAAPPNLTSAIRCWLFDRVMRSQL